MAAVAHGWRPSRVKAPPLSVAREFNRADVAKHRTKKGLGGAVGLKGTLGSPRILRRPGQAPNGVLAQARARLRPRRF
jgi:hypothetical protein